MDKGLLRHQMLNVCCCIVRVGPMLCCVVIMWTSGHSQTGNNLPNHSSSTLQQKALLPGNKMVGRAPSFSATQKRCKKKKFLATLLNIYNIHVSCSLHSLSAEGSRNLKAVMVRSSNLSVKLLSFSADVGSFLKSKSQHLS